MARQGRQGEATERSKPLDKRSLEFRLLVVRAVKGGWTTTQVAKAFGLTRQCVYRWKQQYEAGGDEALKPVQPGREPAAAGSNEPRRRAVAALKEENPHYGARRISAALERFQAIGVSPTEVRRILHEEGLLQEREPAKEREQPETRFERAEPNQLWQSDIFTFLALLILIWVARGGAWCSRETPWR
jgi:transposase